MYDLHRIGWYDFQQLCLTIVRENLGQTVESFLDSNDGGRDGAFTGIWKPNETESITGRFVIQCKFTSKTNHSLTLSEIKDDIGKAQKLVRSELCDVYMLMTNAGLSGVQAEAITGALSDAGVQEVRLFGSSWINQQIMESTRLRMLVPRIYGLGDLSQILDERAYRQGRAILDSLRDDLAKVVVTTTYHKAVEALNNYGFVLLIGEPAAGKTTIASLLAMSAVDQWGSSLLKLDDPRQISDHWNPDEPTQFFWLDDTFGVTQYERSLVRSWNHILPKVKSMLASGAKIVMTSRDYIYNKARIELKESAFPLLLESQVVIDVHDLSTVEKQQILYNHLKLGNQPNSFRSEVKPYLQGIANHKRFVPETARRLAEPIFTKNLVVEEYWLNEFVEKREKLLVDILTGLDIDSKAALALIYMRRGRLYSPVNLQTSESKAISRLNSSEGKCLAALEMLKDSLVLQLYENSESVWHFKHPTIGDAYATMLASSSEHLGIFIQGAKTESLLRQITCGDVGLEKAVIVPIGLFSLVIEKLDSFSHSDSYKTAHLASWNARWVINRFFSQRCSPAFLKEYIKNDPALLEKISKPKPSLNSSPEIDVALRLIEFNLLPEENRKLIVHEISEYTIAGIDGFVLHQDKLRSLFTDGEFQRLLVEVRKSVVTRLDDIRTDFESNYDSSYGDSEDHMYDFREFLGSLKFHFENDLEVDTEVDRQLTEVVSWVNINSLPESEISPRKLDTANSVNKQSGTRSIFDDIDD